MKVYGYKTGMEYTSSKLQVGNFLLFTKYSQILNIAHKFGHAQKILR